MNTHLPPCPRCGGGLSWSCFGETGMAYCKAGQSRRGHRVPRSSMCQFYAEIERVGDVGVRFRYPEEVAHREAARSGLLREMQSVLRDVRPLPSTREPAEDPDMTPSRQTAPTVSPDDLAALRAQLEDAVPWRDGVLTYEQAMRLIAEVERLRALVADKDVAISTLLGILS